MIDDEGPDPDRIEGIIASLRTKFKVKDIREIPDTERLAALCNALELSSVELDELISENSQVLRTVKGHTFEAFFDRLMESNGQKPVIVGGDVQVDRILNGHSLQLKTPTLSGTRRTQVMYKTHKTHGAKSELESEEYYHGVDEFADFLVGLISYRPLEIIILDRNALPRHNKYSERIKSPFTMTWKGHEGLNAWEKLGIKDFSIPNWVTEPLGSDRLLSKTSLAIGLPSKIILDAILREGNFRIWNMNILGFAREVAFRKELTKREVRILNPSHSNRPRAEKADICLQERASRGFVLFQVKGVTRNQCRFRDGGAIAAIETQLSRGRVSDHPTQSRLYKVSDFDFLLLSVEPYISDRFFSSLDERPTRQWTFYCLSVNDLQKHAKYPKRLKSMQKIEFSQLIDHQITEGWYEQWEKVKGKQTTLWSDSIDGV